MFQHDVREEEYPIHAEFKEMVANAQHHANKKQVTVDVSWRGYKMKVKPNLPTFTKYDLDTILLEAVDYLVEKQKKEEEQEHKERQHQQHQEQQRQEQQRQEQHRQQLQKKKKSVSEDLNDIFQESPKADNAYKLSLKKVKARKV